MSTEREKERSRIWYATHKEQFKATRKLYNESHRIEIAEYHKAYKRRSAKHTERFRTYCRLWKDNHKDEFRAQVKKWRKAHPLQVSCYYKVRYALKTGKLLKENCSVCGDPKTHAHHEDYNFPLQVTWLCYKHHLGHHNRYIDEQQSA